MWEAKRVEAAAKFLAEMKEHRQYGIVEETNEYVFFWKPSSAFDQWSPCRFEVHGQLYNCAEQYMMSEKARLFGDTATVEGILAEMHPLKQKNMASARGTLKGFDQKVWDRECSRIVREGNLAKYQQNPELLEALLATGDKTLVEASPKDDIWGIGVGIEEAKKRKPKDWPGKNLLGKILMEVREDLRKDAPAKA